MSPSRTTTQSPAERRLAEVEARKLFDKIAPAHLNLIASARRWLQKRLPTAYELVYEYRDWFVISYSPNEHGYAGVLAIRGSAEGVKLFFNQGKDLADPERLLKGTGKQTRWLPLEDKSTFTRPEVVSLIDAAVALNSVPFASSGRGVVVIRSSSGK